VWWCRYLATENGSKYERSFVLYSELKNKWERERYIEVYTFKVSRQVEWWKMASEEY
jgi:hypothetical protein